MNALVLVDIQVDFLPGGALPVPEGDVIVPLVNRLQRQFSLVVATQDWHPANHASFAANHPGKSVYEQIHVQGLVQTLWPVHCVQNSAGAELAPGLDKRRIKHIFQKGVDPEIDSYSGFFDNGHRRDTGLGAWLLSERVTDLYVCGLATDYCVKFTALDAVQLGFGVFLIQDACRGVNLRPHDVEAAVADMKKRGVKIIQATDVQNSVLH